MTQQLDSSSGSEETSKKQGFNLDQLFQTAIAVPTSVGTLYLYGLRTSDLRGVEALPGDESSAHIRSFLPRIASLVEAKGFKDERPPLTPEDLARLTDADVERVAEVYTEQLWRNRSPDGDEAARPEREVAETAVAYLERVLIHEAREPSRQLNRMREKVLASSSGIFEQVRKSTSALDSTLLTFDKLFKREAPIEISALNIDHFHAMNEQLARQASERAEELEMVRLTGKMTAESAKTLRDLAEAATYLLDQLNERDKKSDRTTRKQINIAVGSVVVSAVLALFALIVSGLGYLQDKSNSAAGDKWQSQLLEAVQTGNLQRDALEKEAQRLRDQVGMLEAKIERIQVTQAAAASTPSISLPRRVVKVP